VVQFDAMRNVVWIVHVDKKNEFFEWINFAYFGSEPACFTCSFH